MSEQSALPPVILDRRGGKQWFLSLITFALIAFVLSQVDARRFSAALAQFPWQAGVTLVAMLALNVFMVWLRFWQMLVQFGFRLRATATWRVFIRGQVAGLLPIPLVGQMSGRALALAAHGVPSDAVAALSVYERGILFVVSGGAAALGATHLLGRSAVAGYLGAIHLPEIGAALLLAGAFAWGLGHSTHERRLFGLACSPVVHRALAAGALLSLLGLLFMLAAITATALTLRPDAHVWDVIAAAAIISFLASLPISVNGWGVREVSAIFLLGLQGFTRDEALAASIVVGVAATSVMLGLAALTWRLKTQKPLAASSVAIPLPPLQYCELTRLAAWGLGGMAAFLLLFQFHAEWHTNVVNLNFADPFALLGLGVIGVNVLLHRQWPRWRIRGVNRWLLAASVVLLLGFVIGAARIGVTSWALSNRLLGWVLLLGYVALGAWLVQQAGRHALRRVSQYLAATALAIVLIQLTLRIAASQGLPVPEFTSNFEGYAANRNAFAFQILVCMAGVLAYARLYARQGHSAIHALALGVLMAGLWFSQSRAGLGTGIVLLLAALILRMCTLRFAALAITTTVAIALVAPAMSSIGSASIGSASIGSASIALHQAYDAPRWRGMVEGVLLWLDAPVFGAGLGVFKHEIGFRLPTAEVIHSTPLWWLAEFGLVGFTVFSGGLLMLAWWTFRRACLAYGAPFRLALLLALAFALFGLVHDIFMQRAFWFMLGATLALPAARPAPSPANG